MAKYMFIFDQRDNSFPERVRVVSAGEDAAAMQAEEALTGTVVDTEALAMLEEMMARSDAHELLYCEFVDAPQWVFIENRYNPAAAEEAQAGKKGKKGEPERDKVS